MSKQNRTIDHQTEEQRRPKKDTLPVTGEQISQQVDQPDLSNELMASVSDPSVQTQSSHLNDSRFQTAQRQTLAAKLGQVGGNQYLSKIALQMYRDKGTNTRRNQGQVTPPIIQREGEDIPGQGVSTPFGDYWVVPDETDQSYPVEGEQITESNFAVVENAWHELEAGSGSIRINETDSMGGVHAGFRSNILAHFGRLLSRPTGRDLVLGLMNGSARNVTIQPTATRKIAEATPAGPDAFERPDGTPGAGTSTTLELDDDLQDDSILAYDAAGNEIASPAFLILGHELIHAHHNALGTNRLGLAPTDTAYTDSEEERAIAEGTPTENELRTEHGYEERYGHGIRDTRGP